MLSPSVTRRVIEDFATRSPRAWAPHPEPGSLTQSEREIVAVVAEGLSNDEIARRLFLSPATARTDVGRAMAKLGARDRTQLVAFAYQSGLAGPR